MTAYRRHRLSPAQLRAIFAKKGGQRTGSPVRGVIGKHGLTLSKMKRLFRLIGKENIRKYNWSDFGKVKRQFSHTNLYRNLGVGERDLGSRTHATH
jgi:hypothetical protein